MKSFSRHFISPKLVETLSVIGVAVLCTLFILHCLGFNLRLFSSAYITFGGDTLLNSWTIYQAMDNLIHRPFDLGYSPIFYGEPAPFAYTIAPYGIALVVWPIYLLSGGNLVLTYNLYLVATFVLTVWFAYLLIRYLLETHFSIALLAGLMIAFAQPRLDHWGHVEQLSTHLYLLTLYFLHRLIEANRLRWSVALGVTVWLMLLTSGYLTMAAVVTGSIILVFMWLRDRRQWGAKQLIPLLAAAGITLVLSLPFLAFRFQNTVVISGRAYDEILRYSAPLTGFFSGTSLLYRPLGPKIGGEIRLWLGLVPIGLSLAAWFWRGSGYSSDQPPARRLTHREVVILYTIITAAGYVLALGPMLRIGETELAPLPYFLLMRVPVFSMLRIPARFFILAITGTALLSAFALNHWDKLTSKPVSLLLRLGIAMVLAVELFPPIGDCADGWRDAVRSQCRSPRLSSFIPQMNVPEVEWLADQPPNTPVLHFPVTGANAYQHYVYLPRHNQPMLNGAGASFVPLWYFEINWSAFPDRETVRFLQQRGICYVIIHDDLLTSDEAIQLAQQWEHYEGNSLALVQQFSSARIYELSAHP